MGIWSPLAPAPRPGSVAARDSASYLRGHARLSMAAIVDASLFVVPGGDDLQIDVPAFTQVIVLTVAASP